MIVLLLAFKEVNWAEHKYMNMSPPPPPQLFRPCRGMSTIANQMIAFAIVYQYDSTNLG